MALSDDIALLSAIPAFAGFEQDALRRLVLSAQTRSVQAGEALYHADEAAEGGFLVLDGEIALRDAAGETVSLAGPGCLLGEFALVIETEWQTTAVAVTDAAVLRLSRALMGRILEEFPLSAAALQQAIAVQLRQLSMELDVVNRLLVSAHGMLPPQPAGEEAGETGGA